MTAATVPFPLIPGKPDVEFRFTIKTARALERDARPFGGLEQLRYRGSNVEVVVMLTYHALAWNMPRLTDEKVIDMLQAFVDAGGNTLDLIKALEKALSDSGVYGTVEPAGADPTTTSEATGTTTGASTTTMATANV